MEVGFSRHSSCLRDFQLFGKFHRVIRQANNRVNPSEFASMPGMLLSSTSGLSTLLAVAPGSFATEESIFDGSIWTVLSKMLTEKSARSLRRPDAMDAWQDPMDLSTSMSL